MPELLRKAAHSNDLRWDPALESQVVRQYRFLLRTAPSDAIEAAHAEALQVMSRSRRRAVLDAVRDGLVTGLRLAADDVPHLAHLIPVGEGRAPGAFLCRCDPAALEDLAERVILAEASFGLFSAYAAWDGSEPDPPFVGPDDSAWGQSWHDRLVASAEYTDVYGQPKKATEAWDHF